MLLLIGATEFEPAATGKEREAEKFVPILEEMNLEGLDRICVEPSDFINDENSQPKLEIHKKEEGGNKLIGRICKLFSRK